MHPRLRVRRRMSLMAPRGSLLPSNGFVVLCVCVHRTGNNWNMRGGEM